MRQSQPAAPARSAGSLHTAGAGRTASQMITRFPSQQMTLRETPAFCIGDSSPTPAEPAAGSLRSLNCHHSARVGFSQIKHPLPGVKEMGRQGRDEMRRWFCTWWSVSPFICLLSPEGPLKPGGHHWLFGGASSSSSCGAGLLRATSGLCGLEGEEEDQLTG